MNAVPLFRFPRPGDPSPILEVRLDDWHCLDCDKDYTVEMFRDPMDVTIDAWVPGYQHCPRCGCVGLSCMEIKLTRQYERERLELEEWRRNHLLKGEDL